MRILFLTSAHNSLSQRLFVELTERGHEIHVSVVTNGDQMIDEATQYAPDLIIAPMLKIAIPCEVYSRTTCLIVHPGIKGDRGPSSLDWAITNEERSWGVTILEADRDFDAGPIWASPEFTLDPEPSSKSTLYRGPVTEAAVCGVLEAIGRLETGAFHSGTWRPEPLSAAMSYARGRFRPPMKQADRSIDWAKDSAATIIRKVRAADSAPGVLCNLLGVDCFLYGAHEEELLRGAPGQILARRDGAICIGAIAGSVWISHLKAKSNRTHSELCRMAALGEGCGRCTEEFCAVSGIKLPATQVLGPLLRDVPEKPLPIGDLVAYRTFREIVYREEDQVGYLSFDFYNGAMSTAQCKRLRDAFLYARSRPTRVIALLGGRDFWSNGIHLNVIEASSDPAEESWQNINAMNDLIQEIVNTMSHLVIAGIRGNAGAGGAILALAADQVFARPSVILNPHYRSMGELYGSEYWTFLLPRRVGAAKAFELTQFCKPLGALRAREIGFLDDVFGEDIETFDEELRLRVMRLAKRADFPSLITDKLQRRLEDEFVKPLSSYREEELQKMRANFFGPDPAYHEARRRFVFKGNPPPADVFSESKEEKALLSAQADWQQAASHESELLAMRAAPHGIAKAWVSLLQVTIRRIFAPAQ